LWAALHEFITQQGGWTTSIPGVNRLRFEVPRGSSLPAKLAAYDPRHVATGTRLTSSAAFAPVDVIEIMLPGK
jgi:hypothetical protein